MYFIKSMPSHKAGLSGVAVENRIYASESWEVWVRNSLGPLVKDSQCQSGVRMMESNLTNHYSYRMDWKGKRVMKLSLHSRHNVIRSELSQRQKKLWVCEKTSMIK